MQTITDIFRDISDEADHIIGTDAENHKEVAIQDAKRILHLCRDGIRMLREANLALSVTRELVRDSCLDHLDQ